MPNNQSPETGKASKFVTVACKLPHGLRLRVYDMEDFDEPVMGGGIKRSKRAVLRGDEVVLNGYAVPHGEQRKCLVVGGFALTSHVNQEFFEEWLKQNKDLPAVKSGLIFAHATQARVGDQAKEQRKMRNGLEPIDPDKPPQVSKRLRVQKGKRPGEAGAEDDLVEAE